MGEVYKARDTRLDRIVAIKVLREHLANDPDRRARFEREARTISKLNHSHICTLYDVGRDNGTDFLVVEYLEGQTLAARQRKGALPIDQALPIAIDIADALDAAHRAGVIHRDLKPANVMLTKSGAKLLDFGIARIMNPPAVTSATTQATLTTDGSLVGTVQYMSPEQLEGREADSRSDIFAFGCVLYEMLTAVRAFPGESQSHVIAAILERKPTSLQTLRPGTPSAIDRLVMKCLAKTPDDRWQTSRDLLDELKWIAGDLPNKAERQSASRSKPIGWLVAALILLAAAGGGAVFYVRRPALDTRVYSSTITPPGNLPGPFALALSPDGRRLAFVAPDASGRNALWVRPLDGLSAQALAGTEGAGAPFWSPDSRFIGFSANNQLKRIDASGGAVLTIAEGSGAAAWSGNDVIVFPSPAPGAKPLVRVAAAGGLTSPATTLDRTTSETYHFYPTFLPDNEHFLFTGISPAEANAAYVPGTGNVYVGALNSPERVLLLRGTTNAKFAQGKLVFVRGTTLMAQPFDTSYLRLTGEPVPIAENVWTRSAVQAVGAFTISTTGVLAFKPGNAPVEPARLTWFDRVGRETTASEGSLKGIDHASVEPEVTLSPDGQQAATVVNVSAAQQDVWVFDLRRGVSTRLTFDPVGASAPVWSPDGSEISFRSVRNGHQDLYRKASTGAGTEQLLLSDSVGKFPESWSPDGRYLLYYVVGPPPAIWALPLFGDRKPFPFIQAPADARRSQFSPDGRWVAYQSFESGRYEVYVVPFPGPGGKWQVSTDGGMQPRWRRDGKELFYLAGTTFKRTLTAVAVSAEGKRFSVGAATPLFDVQLSPGAPANEQYDASPDGQHFFVTVAAQQPTPVNPITLVVNWPALLKH
jgi:Tol biopolymer transport system component